MKNAAMISAHPLETTRSFPALISSLSSSMLDVITFFDTRSEEECRQVVECDALVRKMGHTLLPIGCTLDTFGRANPVKLAELLTNVPQHRHYLQIYTHEIQGRKGHRRIADVAYAASLSWPSRKNYYKRKHCTSEDLRLRLGGSDKLKLEALRRSHHDLNPTQADEDLEELEQYVLLTGSEVPLAYEEASNGFNGVRALVRAGDRDPWGYRSSGYALDRTKATIELLGRVFAIRENLHGIEVGPASGLLTESLLESRLIRSLDLIEPYSEFRELIHYYLPQPNQINLHASGLETHKNWRSDFIIMNDCLYFLDDQMQISILKKLLCFTRALLIGGDYSWVERLSDRIRETTGLNPVAEQTVCGRYEPMRHGSRLYASRPKWKCVLICPHNCVTSQ